MATFTWQLQGSSNTTIGASDRIDYSAGTFGGQIPVSTYQSKMHVNQNGAGSVDLAASNTPNNVKYISSNQCDRGAGTVSVSSVTSGQATFKVNFAHDSAVSISNAKFYAYDGTTITNAPVGVTFYAFEIGNSSWVAAAGSASALALGNKTSATSHDYYICTSAAPSSVGEKTAFVKRLELTYQ
jgi:hypothetical protein